MPVRTPGSVLAVFAIALSLLLQGCAASDSGSGGQIELTFLNQSRGQEAVLNELAEQYTKQTGVKIVVDTPGPSDYLQKLQAKAQSNSMPDIYSAFDAVAMAPFYRAGWAMDLSSEIEGGWGGDFTPAVIEMSTFLDGNNLDVPAGVYTAHWEVQTYGFLVDPAATGIDPNALPANIDEFTRALAAAGGGNFSVAASLTPKLIQSYASNWLTDEEISATFDGKASWKSDGWRNAFGLLADLRRAGVIANNALPGGQDDNPNVETAFFNTHDVGAIFDGSVAVPVGLRTAPDYDDYISMPIPAAANGTLEPRMLGLPGKGAVINPRGDHPQEALAFVKWLTAPEQQKVFAEKGRILPTNPDLLAGDVPSQLTGFASALATSQVLPNTPTTDVNSAIVRNAQSLVLGELTVDQVLDDIQAVQDRG